MVLRIAPTPPRLHHDSAPTDPRIISVHISPSGPIESRLSADLPDSATNHPERAPVCPDSATEEPRIMPNQLKVFGASSLSAKNHQESSRLTTNLLRFTPNHPDSASTHPTHSAPDSGMCNWGLAGAYILMARLHHPANGRWTPDVEIGVIRVTSG